MREIVDAINFIEIPQSEFTLGRNYSKKDIHNISKEYDIYFDWLLKEIGEKTLNIEDFYISEFPITFKMIKSFIDLTGSRSSFNDKLLENIKKYDDDIPAFPVDISEANYFCTELSKYSKEYNFSLPTEPEWEKASKGLDSRIFPWGNEKNTLISNTSESIEQSPYKTTSKIFNSSYFGVKNMGGGIEELTSTNYQSYANSPIKTASVINYVVLRGGTCEHKLDLSMCTRRHGNIPSEYRGFRIVAKMKEAQLENKVTESFYLRMKNIEVNDFILVKLHSEDDSYYYVDLGLEKKGRIKKEKTLDLSKGLYFKSEVIIKVKKIDSQFIDCEKLSINDLDEILRRISNEL